MTALNAKCLQCGAYFHVKPSKLQQGRGKYCSKPCAILGSRISLDTVALTRQFFDDGLTLREIAANTGVSVVTVARHVKELRLTRSPVLSVEGRRRKFGHPHTDISKKKISEGQKRRWPNGAKSPQEKRYQQYAAGAVKRQKEFTLTLVEFLSFWQKPCHYCGVPIKTIGLDRVDNSLGYSLGNVVACCFTCNTMKMSLPLEVFLEHVDSIRRHLGKPSNWIDTTASIGKGTKIWHFASVLSNVVIGSNCSVGSGTEIGSGTIIGDFTRVSAQVFLPSNTRVGSHCFIGPGVTACDDRMPKAGNKNYVAEPPVFKDFCSVGARSVILPGVTIGINAIVGAGSIVTRDVPDGGKVYGEKARLREVSFKHLSREYGWVGGV